MTVRAAQARLPPLIKAQQGKETEQVMSQLKGLGNSLLGECHGVASVVDAMSGACWL